ncbi:MAG: alpha-amylase family protein [Puniceicoccaceae bacterium]
MNLPKFLISSVSFLIAFSCPAQSSDTDRSGWWMTPHRLLQTNLREIDATMDTDKYVREVQDFGANVVLFNVGGIVANYPSELEYQWVNTHMEGDLVGTVLPKLHAAGIKMIGRFDFSKLNEAYAMQHPEWLYVNENGQYVNYNGQVHTCLMGGYQQEYMYEILKEACTRYPLDGVFFNMIGFPTRDYSRVFHGNCQCDNCKRSFKEYCGFEVPKHDGDSEALRKLAEWKKLQIDKQFQRVRETIKSIREDIVILTYTEKWVDMKRQESGHPTGQEPWRDTHRVQWLLENFPDKQLAMASNHFHQMIFRHSGVAPGLHYRRNWQSLVNGAWLDFYCLGPLQRLEDRAGLKTASEVYRFHGANEEWLLNTVSAAEVGIVVPSTEWADRNQSSGTGDDYWGWVQLLTENQVHYDMVLLSKVELSQYKALIVPESGSISSREARLLDEWVKGGGKLLLSGKIPDGMQCLGNPALEATWPERHSMYLRIRPEDKAKLAKVDLKDYDLSHLKGDFHQYSTVKGNQYLLKLVHDVTYGPPEKCYIHSVSDLPGMWVRKHGKGMAAILPFHAGAMYKEWANQSHALLATGTLDNVLGLDRRLKVETSPLVQTTHRRDPDGKFEWVGLQNHSGQLMNVVHEPLPVGHIKIQLRTDKPVTRIRSLTNGQNLTSRQIAPGQIEVILPKLDAFEIVLFEY